MAIRAAVDIGGTFTDVVAFDDENQRLTTGKTLSTPEDLVAGVMNGLAAANVDAPSLSMISHGSTVVINALIERKGARTALVTTRGFRDVYEIGRVNRPNAFDLNFRKHRPLVPREHVFEVTERLRASGDVATPLDLDEARALAVEIRQGGFEAVAVAFLHAYRNPEHEVALGEILRAECPGVYVTLSHQITREYREFERTSTVVANAFVGPVVSNYLARLDDRLTADGSTAPLAIMQSNGGLSDVGTIVQQCVQMLESGPAGGVVGTIEACRSLGYRDAIAFDMGGTTAKASVIRDLRFPQAQDYFVGGYAEGLPMRVPVLDIVEVGTGGGSEAWLDEADGLHVGPRSAGAFPGPACYGRGGLEPTVTDASVALGLLSPSGMLSGGLQLDGDAAVAAIDRVASRVGLGVREAAGGILAIAASSMANAIRGVTTERGLDPRDFALFAYGGNGPLHISLVARELGIRRVVIPREPAVFSALGMLMADLRSEVVQTDIVQLAALDAAGLEERFGALQERALQDVESGGLEYGDLVYVRAADMRYVGQEHTVTVTLPAVIGDAADMDVVKSAFDAAHAQRFGHAAPEEGAEIVSLRVSAIGTLPRPGTQTIAEGRAEPEADARTGAREIAFDPRAEPTLTPVYARDRLLAGNAIAGPAVIEEPQATTVLRPGDELTVDNQGNLLITIEA